MANPKVSQLPLKRGFETRVEFPISGTAAGGGGGGVTWQGRGVTWRGRGGSLTCGQFREDSFTFRTEPGCSLFMSLEGKARRLLSGPAGRRAGPLDAAAGGRGAAQTHSHRMMPSLRPSWKLGPMLMPVTSSIQPRRSSSAWWSYLDAICNTGRGGGPHGACSRRPQDAGSRHGRL